MSKYGSLGFLGSPDLLAFVAAAAIAAVWPARAATIYDVTGSDPTLGYTVAAGSEIIIDPYGNVLLASIDFTNAPAGYSVYTFTTEFQNLGNSPPLSQFILSSSRLPSFVRPARKRLRRAAGLAATEGSAASAGAA
jgi:hypothetical protein